MDGSIVPTYCTATNSGKCKTSYFAYQPENSTAVAGGIQRSCSNYEPLEDEDESILDTRAEPIKVTNFYSTGTTSGGGGVGVGGGGGAVSSGGMQSSIAINSGYSMLKCYSCHAQWTLDSNNDCVKTKITTTTTDCPSLSCESITISFQTTTDTNVLYYAWRGCTVNPEDGIIPNSIILNPTDYLEKKSSQFGKFQDLNIYVERSIQPGIQKNKFGWPASELPVFAQITPHHLNHLYP